MSKRWMFLIASLSFFSIYFFALHSIASAHGSTVVGDYFFEIGFRNEPAVQGEPNALDLIVANQKTGEKINGLESSLKAEIKFGNAKKELQLEAQEGKDGAYTAYVIPTAAGNYTWRIFGTIEGTPVDVSMTSSPETFEAVEPRAEVAFPMAEAGTEGLQGQTAPAGWSAPLTLMLAIAGAILGLLGCIFGFMGWQAARRSGVPSSFQTSSLKK